MTFLSLVFLRLIMDRLFNFGKKEYLREEMTDIEQVLKSMWRDGIGGGNIEFRGDLFVFGFYCG